MNKLSYSEFTEMEKAHEEGNLVKICEKCGDPYKPELRTYNKKTLKKSKFTGEYIKIKKVVGNWFASKHCNNCRILNERGIGK